MSTPSWASAMIQNYQDAYRKRFGMSTKCTPEQIWDICNTVFDDESSEMQDQARIDAMRAIDA